MNKLKEAALQLKNYLGRDKAAIELLDRLMVMANDQRVKLSSITSQFEKCNQLNDELKKQRDQYANELDKATIDLQSNIQMKENAERKLNEIHAKELLDTDTAETINKEEGGDVGRKVRGLIKHVVKKFNKIKCDRKGCLCVHDFIKKFTYDEYASIGMILSSMAFIYGKITLESDYTPKKLGICGEDDKDLARFIHFSGDVLSFSPMQEKIFSQYDMGHTATGGVVTVHNQGGITQYRK